MDLIETVWKPINTEFSEEEVKFLKKSISKDRFVGMYVFYTKESSKDLHIGFIIDQQPQRDRRSAYQNYFEIFCTRPLTNIEYDEMIRNMGSGNRRYLTYWYNCVEQMIIEDKKYHLDTPEDFITECRNRGFYGNYQTKIDF